MLPQVDCGRFPIKRVVGETVIVTADLHADGHDDLAAVTLYRRAGENGWHEAPMEAIGNDRWQAAFTVEGIGAYEYTIEGWIDRFGSWRHELSKKFGAGQDVASELVEGGALVRERSGGFRVSQRSTASVERAAALETPAPPRASVWPLPCPWNSSA